MRVALLQIASPDDESPDARLVRVSAAVLAERQLRDADLLVLPEIWRAGCFNFDNYEKCAEPFAGPSLEAAREWAEAHRINVHLGSFVERDGDHLFNTSAVVAPDGSVVARYRKVHLFGYGSRESQLLTAGNTIGIGEIAQVPTGITTCYDLRFPELYRSLVDAGALQFAVCSAWPTKRLPHWLLFTTTRAVEEQAYLFACNAVGLQRGHEMAGRSRVVDPWGEVIAEAGTDEGFTYADIDPDRVHQVRSEFPALADRRWRPED